MAVGNDYFLIYDFVSTEAMPRPPDVVELEQPGAPVSTASGEEGWSL